MPPPRGPTVSVRACGEFAVFTQPALKAEKVSYPVMTPSAARGLLEAILWKPAIVWEIENIRVLKPIRFTSFRRNGVSNRASAPSAKLIKSGGEAPRYYADEDRAQFNTVALMDVDYVIDAHFSMTERAGPEDSVKKFEEMFARRLEKGQTFTQPYLGCREFAADVMPATGDLKPIEDTRELGRMLFDIDYARAGGKRALFFDAVLRDGVLAVPSRESMMADSENGGAR